uniref:single-stranded DNA-binding protein n=1 Tax=Lachnoclostridium phocaeense TaxID=1871021 RepID=UPI0026DBCBE4|nr:single-stranded DNA-binding protein [Lachnoclostridium phocaeense]
MARENTVTLTGMVAQDPRLSKNPETDEYIFCAIQLLTVRKSYANREYLLKGLIRSDLIRVLSRNEELIRHSLSNVSAGEFIMIKGTLCTKEIPRTFICPEPDCNYEYVKEQAVSIYIDPIFCTKIHEPILDEQERERYLDTLIEVSNDIKIFGTLCRTPEYYETETHLRQCQFQLATNRIRRIREDGPDKRTDYPWVKVFGERALECAQSLRMNSTIYINGAIQVRTPDQVIICPRCGKTYRKKVTTMEIVPYHIEYINNCTIPESQREEEEGLDFEEKQ